MDDKSYLEEIKKQKEQKVIYYKMKIDNLENEINALKKSIGGQKSQ